MKRQHVITAVAITLTLSTAALAQNRNGPDFSPMKPDTYDEPRSQSSAPQEIAPPQNRMLDAYEASAVPQTDSASSSEPYEPRVHPRLYVAPPRQSTIGNGLFDRRGPDDFGS